MLKTERRKLLLFYFYTEQEEIKFTNEYTRFLSCPLIRLLSFTRRHLLYMECMWSLSLSSLTLCSIPFSFKQILFQMTLATCLFFSALNYLFVLHCTELNSSQSWKETRTERNGNKYRVGDISCLFSAFELILMHCICTANIHKNI